MSMTNPIPLASRRTTADAIFDQLRDQIMGLELLPGTKMSEAEIAQRFGVSRQPVREAFNLLSTLDLLLVQPQKATRVQRFSASKIKNARFIRRAIEIEISKTACQSWTTEHQSDFDDNIKAQHEAVAANDTAAFHALDREFHRLIAAVADTPLAFEQVDQNKAQVDRICVLSLKRSDEMQLLVDDHIAILHGLSNGDQTAVETAVRLHLSRIDTTIDEVRANYPKYFED